MIRFRLIEDERRYLLLRAELYLRLSQSGVDAAVLSDVLRNLGKIESFAYAEGIRQGAVAHAGSDEQTVGFSALDLHHEVYGHADTPLREIEKKRWGSDATAGVFEEMPLEFAPLTLTEARKFYTGQQAAAATVDVPALLAAGEQVRTKLRQEISLDDTPLPDDADRHNGEEDDLLFDVIGIRRPEGDDMANEHLYEVSSPDFLDRVRDELLAAQEGGAVFKQWEDLIYHLHIALGIDAGALDLQLSTHEGRAILDQAGFFNFPPASDSFDMTRFLDVLPPEITTP